MDWVKLTTNYYFDAAIMRAGEAAEVLFTRALAYCGDQENGGLVPREVLPRLVPTRGLQRASALVREGIWEQTADGWRFVRWEKHQTPKDRLEARREAGRARQAAFRDRKAPTPSRRNAVTDAVSNDEVTRGEVEGEVDAAAAAAGDAAAAADLPGALAVFRSKLQAHTALAALRFDSLTPAQLEELSALVELHGDDRLAAVARDTCRNPAPIYVTAFLGSWRALPPPGQRLAAVQRLCDTHSTVLTGSGTCNACAADQKAAR